MSHQVILLRKDEEVEPLAFFVLVKVNKEEKTSEGGIVIAEAVSKEQATRASMRGTVIKVGPLAGRDPGDCPENWGAVVGTEIVFTAYAGVHYQTEDGQFYICLPEKEACSKIVKKQ